MPRSMPTRLLAGLAAATLALAACSSSDGDPGEDALADAADPTTTDAPGDAMSELDLTAAPPTELVVERLAPPADADAPKAAAGDAVLVHYEGRAWSNGEVFDSSAGRDPIGFTVGVGQVIEGWDLGIAGLQVGERARLIIPPDLAYGASGVGPIGPNETLIFEVELVEITSSN